MIYLKQWAVDSESSDRTYTVSLCQAPKHYATEHGLYYECSCIGWTRHTPRRDCKHILWVRHGGGREIDPCLMAMLKASRKGVAA
jgi:hypothetical protein